MNLLTTDPNTILTDMLAPLVPLFFVLMVLGLVAVVMAIAYFIRVWSVQSATLKMQKDIADIKRLLEKESPVPKSNQNDTIA